VLERLRALEALIVGRAPAEAVRAATGALVPELRRVLGMAAADTTADAARGKAIYAAACATCHGAEGRGDGPQAAGLTPPPIAFAERLSRMSAEQVYGAVTFGIDGTAMASFRDTHDEQQRRDVAAFVMTFASAAPSPSAPADADPGLAVALQLQDAFTRIAERVLPSVVGVTSFVEDPDWTLEKLTAERGMEWIQANAEDLRYPGYRKLRSGSGFLVSDDGYVLSANHVVRDEQGEVAKMVSVELRDGRHVTSRVVGAEPTIDLAVLQLLELTDPAERKVPPVTLGDSDAMQVGHWVIALGNPPGPDVTYAVGTLAARPEQQCYQADLSRTLFQTSVTIPPESYGGPLVDIRGRVIGIDVPAPPRVDLDERGGRSSYALPIGLALNIYEALKVAQSDRSPWIGVSVLDLPGARRRLGSRARAIEFPRTGIYIDDVFDPSPAFAAGIRPGDFLTGMGTHRVLSVADFQKWLYLGGIGSPVELELFREGKAVKHTVTIEQRPPEATTR
jgi:serine protease Do